MTVFTDYLDQEIKMDDQATEHISKSHIETTPEKIKLTLGDPDEVRKSQHKEDTKLYYKKQFNEKGKLRFTTVVVKSRPDGNWIDSAMTTSKVKKGEIIYQKNEMEV